MPGVRCGVLRQELTIEYAGESGEDAGGLRRQFFDQFTTELKASPLWCVVREPCAVSYSLINCLAGAGAGAGAAAGPRRRREAFDRWIALPFHMRLKEHYGTTWRHAGGYASLPCLRVRARSRFSN